MSEITKPVEAVEQSVVAATVVDATAAIDPAPVDTAAVAELTADSAVPITTEAAQAVPTSADPVVAPQEVPVTETSATVVSETTAENAEEVTFAGESVLGYKPAGIFKGILGFQKKFFWFGQEPVATTALSAYIKSEKAAIAKEGVAWASHTGKGLLLFSKHSSEKETPAGLFNLANVSDITEDGTVEFHFVYHGAKHHFQSSTASERNSWITALKAQSTEAKALADTVINSEEYKKQFKVVDNKLVNAAAAVTGTAGVAGAVKAEENKKTKTEETADAEVNKKEESATTPEEKKEETATPKARSQSQKRLSMFKVGKKTESKEKEVKMETKSKEVSGEVPAVESIQASDSAVPAAESTTITPPVNDNAPVATSTIDKSATNDTDRPTATNRRNSSYFLNLASRFTPKKSPVGETAPKVPEKDIANTTEPISANAPVIPAPSVADTTTVDSVTEPVPAEQPTGTVLAEEKANSKVEDVVAKPARRKSLFSPKKKEKSSSSESESEEKKLSTYQKLRQTVKNKMPKNESTESNPPVPASDGVNAVETKTTPAELSSAVETTTAGETKVVNIPEVEGENLTKVEKI